MSLSDAWEDDQTAFLMLLIFICPLPFIYAGLNILGFQGDALRRTYYTVIIWGVGWMAVGAVYALVMRRRRKKQKKQIERMPQQ